MNVVITVGFDHDESVTANDRSLTIGIAFKSLPVSSSFPFWSGAVETLCPRCLIICTVVVVVVTSVAADFDSTGDSHVKNFADPSGVVTVVLEML
jgi:hypothetical protein